MVSKQHLTSSFKLETEGSQLDGRMSSSLKKYQIDMVIGNVWGNKNWIKVKFNQDVLGKHEDIEYDQQVEKSIVDSVLVGWKHKFGAQTSSE